MDNVDWMANKKLEEELSHKDFVPVLQSVDEDLTTAVFLLLCGPDLLRCRRVSKLWRFVLYCWACRLCIHSNASDQ